MSLLVNHSIQLEERAKVYYACARAQFLYATWALMERLERLLSSCDHRMLKYMSRVRWQDRITNKEVRRRCRKESLEHRLSRDAKEDLE